jgi:prepilin-type N-terminal cleavage/methylation domain-containing protein
MQRERGFTLIELMIVIAIIAILAAIAIPNLLESRKASNEAAAVGALRTLVTAQALFREGDKDRNKILDFATSTAQLGTYNLVDSTLATGTKQGYSFTILNATQNQFAWSAAASPIIAGKTGDRQFYVDATGVIRFSTSGPATSTSIPVGG